MAGSTMPPPPNLRRKLTPEEDVVDDPDNLDGGIDELLPADLWFRCSRRKRTTRA